MEDPDKIPFKLMILFVLIAGLAGVGIFVIFVKPVAIILSYITFYYPDYFWYIFSFVAFGLVAALHALNKYNSREEEGEHYVCVQCGKPLPSEREDSPLCVCKDCKETLDNKTVH